MLMDDIKKSSDSVSLLVDHAKISDKDFLLWCTISPNPKTKHKCAIKKVNKNGQTITVYEKRPYRSLPQRLQYEYCIKIINTTSLPYIYTPRFICTTELNKNGNVHFHFLLKGNNLKNKTDLMVFQRDVSLCPEVLRNQGENHNDYMNNIVHVTKPLKDIIAYMSKDNDDNIKHFPNLIIK